MRVFETEYGLISSTTPMLTAIKIFQAKELFQNISFELNEEIEIKFNENQRNNTKKVYYIYTVKRVQKQLKNGVSTIQICGEMVLSGTYEKKINTRKRKLNDTVPIEIEY
jgi:hypothetical protein